jgi:hypothetical protein
MDGGTGMELIFTGAVLLVYYHSKMQKISKFLTSCCPPQYAAMAIDTMENGATMKGYVNHFLFFCFFPVFKSPYLARVGWATISPSFCSTDEAS